MNEKLHLRMVKMKQKFDLDQEVFINKETDDGYVYPTEMTVYGAKCYQDQIFYYLNGGEDVSDMTEDKIFETIKDAAVIAEKYNKSIYGDKIAVVDRRYEEINRFMENKKKLDKP
jgi:hypothetical protein